MKPKLTLRDLFWLTLVCTLALGWSRDHFVLNRRMLAQQEFLFEELRDKFKLAKELDRLGYTITETDDGMEISKP